MTELAGEVELTPAEQVRIARMRERLSALRATAAGAVSIRVPGTDLFLLAVGNDPLDHLLCDLSGRVIPHIPSRLPRVLPDLSAHVEFHRSVQPLAAAA